MKFNNENDFETIADPDVSGGVSITRYSGAGGKVNIPASINGSPVTGIGYFNLADDRRRNFSSYGLIINVTIPNSVIKIRTYAFLGCDSLKSVTIPDSVTSICDGAFSGCIDLTAINVSPDNSAYSSQDGVLYKKDKTELILYPERKKDVSFTIPDGVTSIGEGAFCNCTNLTNITIPDGVTRIERGLFIYYCESLTSVTIGANVNFVGYDYDHFFVDAYYEVGQVAGTYTRPNTESSEWTRN
jgi:hypothetical protein